MHDLILSAFLLAGPAGTSPAPPVADIPATEPEVAEASTVAADDSASAPDVIVPILFGHDVETLSTDELKEQRGGSTLIVNNQTLLGVVQGNVVGGDYVAGQVALSDSALSNFNGLLSLAINTGLQSNIISGMAVTINLGD